MPVTVPVTNQNALPFSNPGGSLVTPSLVTSSLTDPRLLSPQQPALQRNTVSPALPQRPASAGTAFSLLFRGVLGSVKGTVQTQKKRKKEREQKAAEGALMRSDKGLAKGSGPGPNSGLVKQEQTNGDKVIGQFIVVGR